MKLRIDRKAGAAYVRLAEGHVARTKELDHARNMDYDATGEVLGIEFLDVSHGVDLSDLPFRPELERLFEERGIRQYA